jgi:2-polyprenyl-6-hydroxyphenyl methylase/3-demethylubiquinone-9 3-methyltransferase
MNPYYAQKLSGERLEHCYRLAPPRVQRYLDAEINFVIDKIKNNDIVLELGCGYGRIFPQIIKKAKIVFGIDNSFSSLIYTKKYLPSLNSIHLSKMNAVELGFKNQQFDAAICIQNGLSAFKVNQRELVGEAIRVTRKGGLVLFSSYSEEFWDHRLEWFRIQSENSLIGEIDYDKTGNGVIVCKDGFRAVTITRDDFISLTANSGSTPGIIEIDNSSIFCVLKVE